VALASDDFTSLPEHAAFGQTLIATVTIRFVRGLTSNATLLLETSHPNFVDELSLVAIEYNDTFVSLAPWDVLERASAQGSYNRCGIASPGAGDPVSAVTDMIGHEHISEQG